jgi:2-desacetyl-2-hydroxyethyl bacteriochlorophyllide A dehydrogenase
MRAVQVTRPSTLAVNGVPEPDPADRVMVRSGTVGICGSDVKIFKGAVPVDYPRIMGHEMVGTVVTAPSGSSLEPGQRVLVDPAPSCGTCDLCRRGRNQLCRRSGLMGREMDGVFAELVAVPERQLLPVPDSISATAAGLLQVLGTCVHALRPIDVFPGQTAVVLGLGVAGQLMVQLLREHGLNVIGITRAASKRELAQAHGAVETAPLDEADDAVSSATDGRGADLVVECVGYEATLAKAIQLAGTGGEIVAFGTITGGNEGLPYYDLYYKELTIHNPRAALPGDYAAGIRLAATGRLALEPIVTHELTLEDAEEAFRIVGDPSSLKVLMHVNA